MYGYRRRLFEGVRTDIRQRYTGSVFGSFWAFLFPFLQLSIYAGLYTVIFKVRPSGLTEFEYVLLVVSGLVPLMAFSEVLMASTSSLTANRNLLLNTVFPAELIPVRSGLAAHVTSIVGLCIALVYCIALGRANPFTLVLVPFFWLLLLMFALGLGWMLSLLSLIARDINHGIGIVVMLLFVLSPFAYTPDMVPATLKAIIYFNPLSYFVLCFQSIICYGELPSAHVALGATILGVGFFFAGFTVFQRAKHIFFDFA